MSAIASASLVVCLLLVGTSCTSIICPTQCTDWEVQAANCTCVAKNASASEAFELFAESEADRKIIKTESQDEQYTFMSTEGDKTESRGEGIPKYQIPQESLIFPDKEKLDKLYLKYLWEFRKDQLTSGENFDSSEQDRTSKKKAHEEKKSGKNKRQKATSRRNSTRKTNKDIKSEAKQGRKEKSTRAKRSTFAEQTNLVSADGRITWKVGVYTSRLTKTVQLEQIALAFKEWASKSRLCFGRVSSSATADITLDFSFGNSKGNSFYRTPKIYADTIPGKIFFNAYLKWKAEAKDIEAGSRNPAVLQTVAMHEIGHVLGFAHVDGSAAFGETIDVRKNAVYLDRAVSSKLLTAYGGCDHKFSSLIDIIWIEYVGRDRTAALWFKTMIAGGSKLWQYTNLSKKPVDGYPVRIYQEFPRARSNPVMLQGHDYQNGHIGKVFIFEGERYRNYSYSGGVVLPNSFARSSVQYSGAFKYLNGVVSAAYFDFSQNVAHIFVGAHVWTYSYIVNTDTWRYKRRRTIASEYECISQDCAFLWGIDAAYAQLETGRIYFFRGGKVWEKKPSGVVYLGRKKEMPEWSCICSDDC